MKKRIKVRGYYRKDGTWISEHYRHITPSKQIKKIRIKKSKHNDPNQLTFDF